MKNIADYFRNSYETAVRHQNPLEFIHEAEDLTADILTYLADIYSNEYKDIEKAKNIMLIAKELFPWEWKIYNNLCDYHYKRQELEEAEEYAKEAIAKCDSTEPIVLYNLACIYYDLGKKKESINLYRQVLNISPNFHVAKYNLACSLIYTQNFQDGWELYEERFKAFDHINDIRKRYNYPYLEKLDQLEKGKTLLLFNEQGLGDVIFSLRYINYFRKNGINILYDLDDINQSLLKSTKIKNIKWHNPSAKIDFVCSFMSFPHLFSSYPIPKDYSLLFSKWKKPKNKIPKVGLVFSGSPNHPMDYRRSMKLSQLSSIYNMPNIEFHLLQKKDYMQRTWKDKTVNLFDCEFPGKDRSDEITNFKDTITIMKELDLLISVDTSSVHLAGAIGLPCIVLLDKGHDYRWGETEDNAWYDSVFFARQTEFLTWNSAIKICINKLNSMLNLRH